LLANLPLPTIIRMLGHFCRLHKLALGDKSRIQVAL
jgi:hypothetical protein